VIHGTRKTFVLQRTAEEFIFDQPGKTGLGDPNNPQ